jgi:hypothetical protein
LGTFLSLLRTVSNLLELSSEPPRVFSNLLEPSRTFSNISHLCVRLDLLDLKENLAENDEPWRHPASSPRHTGFWQIMNVPGGNATLFTAIMRVPAFSPSTQTLWLARNASPRKRENMKHGSPDKTPWIEEIIIAKPVSDKGAPIRSALKKNWS